MPVVREERDGVEHFCISNGNGVVLRCITIGASITRLLLPDKTDLVLGYKDVKDYLTNPPYIGCSVGRSANRIREAKFVLDGGSYQLSANVDPHHLHGGTKGFHRELWTVVGTGENSVTMQYTSVDGDDGYPGNVTATVTYSLNDSNEVSMEYSATTDAPTIVNLTNHTYFNLNGKGTIHNHVLMMNSASYTPLDEELIAKGTVESVVGTALDFRTPTAIGLRMSEVGGYDFNYTMNHVKDLHETDPSLKHCASLSVPSKCLLKLYTNQVGIQLYTGNFLDGSYLGKDGLPIAKHAGVCLEAQAWPNAINNPVRA